MENFKISMEAALGRKKADLVLKNANIINGFTQNIEKGDIAIVEDKIVGIGSYNGIKEIDCTNYFVSPGFIDAHVHIESSKVIPQAFSRILIKKGVTTCIADPHEIANVLGEEGIRFMIQDSKKGVIDIFFMMPSCVPAVDFEDNGASLDGESLSKFLKEKSTLGLGEVMDVPAVVNLNENMQKKLEIFKDYIIDGHCPQISESSLNAYIFSGIKTDHECTTKEQALEKVKRGMYVMLREGSAAKNLRSLIQAVDEGNFHRFLFCTDDKDIVDLEKYGSIDYNIRTSIKLGIDPIKAYTMATLNAASAYGLKDRGAIAPGLKADLVILEDLEKVKVKYVVRNGCFYNEEEYMPPSINLPSSMNILKVDKSVFNIKCKGKEVNVIKVTKGSIETEKVKREIIEKNKNIIGLKSDDYMKIAVFERHKNTGKYSVGFIEGLGVKNISIAQTIAHDSHNIIVVGDNDEDMTLAVNRLIDMKGGVVIVSKGEILGELSLSVAGLMTNKTSEFAIKNLSNMNNIIRKYSKNNMDVFVTLSFMALPVIPEIKITDRGLYYFKENKFISLEAN